MAKILLGGTIGDARGSSGATVYSKNQFGAYIRQKVSPVQPRTPTQTLVRQVFADLSKRWATILSDAQRTAWIALAAANPVIDVFGNSQILTGIQFFQRVNRNLQSIATAILDDAPADQNVTNLQSLSVAADASAGTVVLTFTATPLGLNDAFVIFATPLLNPGRQFTKSFMRQINYSVPNVASPLNTGGTWVQKYGALAVGQRLGVMISVVRNNNGAASPFLFANTIVVA